MEYQDTYNLVLDIAKRLEKPRSFLEILKLLKTYNISPETFFGSIKAHYDDIISSFIISRTKLTSQLGVGQYYEREAVAAILSTAKANNDNATTINKTLEQNGLGFRLPQALDDNQLFLIKNTVIANNCIDICRIGNNSDKIYEISFYARYYFNMDPAKIKEIHDKFSETLKFTMDHILEMDTVKKRIIADLREHGRPGGIMQNDSIDKLFHILDHEIAAMEIVLGVDQLNQKLDDNNIYDYATLWFLSLDFKKRDQQTREKIKAEE